MEHQHYIFVANDISMIEDRKISAIDIKDTLLKQGFWSFSETAPLRAKLKEGDKVLVYLAGPGRRAFVAVATIANDAEELERGSKEKKILSELGIGFLKYKVQLKDIVNFPNGIKITHLIDKLNFIVDKKNYGLHLRLPIVRINLTDFLYADFRLPTSITQLMHTFARPPQIATEPPAIVRLQTTRNIHNP